MKLSPKQAEVVRRMAQHNLPVEVGYYYTWRTIRVLRDKGLVRIVHGTIFSAFQPRGPQNAGVTYNVTPREVTLAVLTPSGIKEAEARRG